MSTIWVNKPMRHYIITTDQKTFEIDRDWLDYKATIARLRAAGYTGIKINCIGKRVII